VNDLNQQTLTPGKKLQKDLIAGLVVFLVALPLCLGIALASDAPLASGLLAGIIGGLIVGSVSGSSTSVSGPAAGLTAIVSAQIAAMGSFEAFLTAVFLAGLIQIVMGLLKAGTLSAFFPSSVIKGLLAAIGTILILKQIPHFFGDDNDFEGEMSFLQPDQQNTFSEIATIFQGNFHQGALLTGLLCITVLIVWPKIKVLSKTPFPPALAVVLLGVAMHFVLQGVGGDWAIDKSHRVDVPKITELADLFPKKREASPESTTTSKSDDGKSESVDSTLLNAMQTAVESAFEREKASKQKIQDANSSSEQEKDDESELQLHVKSNIISISPNANSTQDAIGYAVKTLVDSPASSNGNSEIEFTLKSNISTTIQKKEKPSWFAFPDFSAFFNLQVYIAAITIAIVASLETLLNLEAVDKLDPKKRHSPASRELIAQGVGNSVGGLIGSLPVTSVIIRSSVNIHVGAETKKSTIIHGIFLVLSVGFFAKYLNYIPLSSLAAILLVTGYKLANPKLFRSLYQMGPRQFLPFIVTLLAIVFTDLLVGVIIGMCVGLVFILASTATNPLRSLEAENDNKVIRIVLAQHVSFLSRFSIKKRLASIEPNSSVIFDGSKNEFIDEDTLEMIADYIKESAKEGITASAEGLDLPTESTGLH